MRIGRAVRLGEERVVVQRDGALWAWSDLYPRLRISSALDAVSLHAAGATDDPSDATPLPSTWSLTSPMVPVRNVMCVGTNYAAHVAEFAAFTQSAGPPVPEAPIIFTKPPEALCGPYDDIVVDPSVSTAIDYEVELAIVIGLPGARIDRTDARRHVAAYSIINDTTARDRQQIHKQWFLSKSLYAATPFGPVLVTPDEIPDVQALEVRSLVNGTSRQRALVADMIFDIDMLIECISAIFPLRRGDVIATGTPSGVGISFTPPRYLLDGDEVRCGVTSIGELANVVRFADPFELARESFNQLEAAP